MPKKWSFLREDPITGKRYFKLEIIEAPKLVEPPSLTELPPPGLEGVPLTKEKPVQPQISGGGKERPHFSTFIELSQPREPEELSSENKEGEK